MINASNATRNFSLHDVHVEGTSRIADAVAKYDVDRFVHVSSHSVSKDSPSPLSSVLTRFSSCLDLEPQLSRTGLF